MASSHRINSEETRWTAGNSSWACWDVSVANDPHADPPEPLRVVKFHSHGYQLLAQRPATTRSGVLAADERLVHLDRTGKQVVAAARTHRGPITVKHRSRRLVGAQAE